MNNPNYGLKTFLLFVVAILLTPVVTYYNAFVLCKIYNWFVLPIPGAPNIPVGNMIGIVLIMGMLCVSPILQHITNSSKDEKEKAILTLEEIEKNLAKKLQKGWMTILGSIFAPSLFWFMAYLYHNWFM